MSSVFPEEQLVQNRSAVLLHGGSESDRRGWAEEAALRLSPDGALTVLSAEAELPALLGDPRRVVLVPNAAALSQGGQVLLLKALLERDERPKLILGLPSTPLEARLAGALRDDLAYRLQVSQVDLSQPGLKAQVKERRAKLERELERKRAEADRQAKMAARQQEKRPRAAAKPSKPAKKAMKAKPTKPAKRR